MIPPSVPALELADVSTGYGDLKVVHDLSFAVAHGAVTALLGRNGAGKTTTLRAIAGLNPVTSGSVLLDGKDVSRMPARKRVPLGLAYVQEGKRVFHRHTVEQNLVLGAYSTRLSRGELAERLDGAYARFPVLAGRRDVPAAGLSGGQQQMLAIAQALMSHPRVLLLDEPSGGLAPAVVGEVLASIRQLVEEGLAVILVEQAISFALALADDVVVMDLGRPALRASAREPGIEQAIEDAYFGRTSLTP